MELDTGAAKSLISQTMYNDLWFTNARPKLRPCNQVLKVYGGQMLPVLGEITVVAQLEHRAPKDVNLVVIRGDDPALTYGKRLITFARDYKNFSVYLNSQQLC